MSQRNNVIMASSYKGGAGKSTIAMNLAAALKYQGANVLVVDLDEATRTAQNWQANWAKEHEEAAARGVPPPLPPVISVLSDSANTIEAQSASYDYVIVDAGAGTPRQNQDAIRAADLLLLPVTPSQFDIAPTLKYIWEIAALQQQLGGRPKARVVFTRMNKSRASSAELTESFKGLPVPALKTEIPARESLTKLLLAGQSVYEYPRASDLRPIFDSLAEEVLEALIGQVAQSNSGGKKAKA